MKKPDVRIVLLFFIISLFLYFWDFDKKLIFDADQEYYANQYVEIVKNHKLTLLGIETSVGKLFVGPLYTYCTAFIYWLFQGDPIGIYLLTLFAVSFQASLTYILFTKLATHGVGVFGGIFVFLALLLWGKAYAPSVINTLYPMGLLFFYALGKLKEHKRYLPLLGFLLGLSLHLHVSLWIFFPIVLFVLFQQKKSYFFSKEFALTIGIIVLFLSPLLLFELRHQFFVAKNILLTVQHLSITQPSSLPLEAGRRIYAVLTSFIILFTTILTPSARRVMYGFLCILIWYFFTHLGKHYLFRLSLLIFSTSFVIFLFYPGSLTDYYFYFQLAPFFFIVAFFFGSISQNKIGYQASIGIISVLTVINIQQMLYTINPYNLSLKKDVAAYIKAQTQDQPVQVYYDTDLGLQFGFDYLLRYKGVWLVDKPDNLIYQIIIRSGNQMNGKIFYAPGSPVAIRVVQLDKAVIK